MRSLLTKMSFRILNCRIFSDSERTKIVNLSISRARIVSITGKRIGYKTRSNDYDAKGKLVLPAFIDSHCHLFSLAEQDEEVELRGCKSIQEMQGRIEQHIRSRGQNAREWIFGRGWDQDLFNEKRLPSRADLDQVTNKLPIVMARICGHIAVMNSRALDFFKKKGAFVGLGEELVTRDPNGNPVGIVKENALSNCWAMIPKPSIRDLQRLFLKAQSLAFHYGLAGVHCILDDLDQLKAIKQLDQRGRVRIKASLFLPIDVLQKIEQMDSNRRKNLLIGKKTLVVGFKLFADGSLGARTAALNEDYSDDTGNRGILNYTEDRIIDYAKRVKGLGLILATHAIGDRAVEQVALAYKKAGIKPKDSFRIEHCSIINPDRILDLSGIVLSIQPMFATSDYWLKNRIGNSKTKRVGYPFRSLAKKNLLLGGSDAPVESINPLAGINAATMNNADSSESLSLAQAIQMYTLNAAKQSPLTKNYGSIRIGRTCDVVVLDIVDPQAMPKSQVIDLFIDGNRILR
jgi:predicted amidohydrolase YtcJ